MDFYSKARNSISLNEAIEFAQKAIAEDKTFTEASSPNTTATA